MNILTLAESPEMFICLLLLCSAASSAFYSWRSRSLYERNLHRGHAIADPSHGKRLR